jgi:hypothetical protein
LSELLESNLLLFLGEGLREALIDAPEGGLNVEVVHVSILFMIELMDKSLLAVAGLATSLAMLSSLAWTVGREHCKAGSVPNNDGKYDIAVH